MIIFILLLLHPHSFPFPNLIDKVSNFGYLLYRPSAKSRHWLATSNDKDSRNCCDRYVCEIDLRFLWNSHFRFAIYPCELQLFWAIITCPLLTDEVFHFCAPACWDALERGPISKEICNHRAETFASHVIVQTCFCKNILMLAASFFFTVSCVNLLKTIALVIFSGLSILVSGLVLGFLDPTFAPYMKKVSVKTEIYLHLTFSFFFFFFKALFFLISD